MSIYSITTGISVQEFYSTKIVSEVKDSDDAVLEFASLGKSKELLDNIELTLPLEVAVHTFGTFLRYCTKSI